LTLVAWTALGQTVIRGPVRNNLLALDRGNAMEQPEETPGARTVIGGRHGSPSLTIALPFARITNTDTEIRDVVAELATLVAQLAAAVSSGDVARISLSRKAAEELAERITSEH
jgi:hypothetical protein